MFNVAEIFAKSGLIQWSTVVVLPCNGLWWVYVGGDAGVPLAF